MSSRTPTHLIRPRRLVAAAPTATEEVNIKAPSTPGTKAVVPTSTDRRPSRPLRGRCGNHDANQEVNQLLRDARELINTNLDARGRIKISRFTWYEAEMERR